MEEKRILLASYQRLTDQISKVINKNLLTRFQVYNETNEAIYEIVKEQIANNLVDVIVSGSSNYILLKESFPSVPIIPIEVSGLDLLEALKKAGARSNYVAVISYKNYLPWDVSYAKLFRRKVNYISYNKRENLGSILTKLKKAGCGCVIGSSVVCDMAEETGLSAVFIYSKNSLASALQRAVEIQESIQREQERNQQLSLIIDLIPSGIISINKNNHVTLYNDAAARLTGIPLNQAIGKNITEILPNTRLPEVLNKAKAEMAQLQKMPNGITILTNRAPIMVKGKARGAVATFNNIDEISKAEHKIRQNLHNKGFVAKRNIHDIVGSSDVISEARELAKIYAIEDTAVLLTGETGTGKEMFAQGIHNWSSRKAGPFVAINCSALSEEILVSELFGYEEGAFTGARKGGKIGLLELGHRGTVFLDEIGTVSVKVQSHLLRVLEEKEIMRLGSDKVIPVDIRVIAATNVPLDKEITKGSFRQDLYYRLNVMNIFIPPLRERKEDLPQLIHSILKQEGKEHIYETHQQQFEHVLYLLENYNWPGNVRELRNVIQRLCLVFANNLNLNIALNDLPLEGKPNYDYKLDRNTIYEVLQKTGGNRRRTSELLKVSRTTLWRRMKELEL
ncbi:MAG: sigma 54-interacting transcriptional regulator [Bacillota bacterium]